MAAIYHPGVVLTVPHYNVGSGRDAVNVIAWQTAASGLTISQLTAVQSAFNTVWSADWKNLGHSSVSYLGCWVIDMSSNTAAQVPNTGYTAAAGTATGTPLGDNTAYLISLKTLTRYRGGHARIYVPGVASSNVNPDGSTVNGGGIASMNSLWNDAANAMLAVTGVNGGPYTPVVWHKKLSSNPNSVENVIGHTSQVILATQRRRLRKVSRHRRRTSA